MKTFTFFSIWLAVAVAVIVPMIAHVGWVHGVSVLLGFGGWV